jgi:hypothetical protein
MSTSVTVTTDVVMFNVDVKVTATITSSPLSDDDIEALSEFLSEEPTFMWSPNADPFTSAHYLYISEDGNLVEVEMQSTPVGVATKDFGVS